MGLLYGEDNWPNLPKFHTFFAGILEPKEINRCFCKGLGTNAFKAMKKIAKTYPGVEGFNFYDFNFPDVTKLPKIFKRLNKSDQAIVEHWVQFLVFMNCIGDGFIAACQPEPPVYNG